MWSRKNAALLVRYATITLAAMLLAFMALSWAVDGKCRGLSSSRCSIEELDIYFFLMELVGKIAIGCLAAVGLAIVMHLSSPKNTQ